MGILYDDVVLLNHSEREGDPSVITVNCPDKTGLGSDLCRIILFFGLTVVRVERSNALLEFVNGMLKDSLLQRRTEPTGFICDVSTDGIWCYIVFWVVGRPDTRWNLLKKRLMGACPSCSSASGISYYRAELSPRPPDVFLLTFCCNDRRGLLHDVTAVLSELELTIKKVKVSTTPDGKVMDLFFITDTRELLHTKKRQEDTHYQLKSVLGDAMISCDIEMVGSEIAGCSQGPSFLPQEVAEDMFSFEILHEQLSTSLACNKAIITIDNLMSPGHTLIKIACQDHKAKTKTECELELFIMQADGKKIVDHSKLNGLCSRLQMELCRPLRVSLMNRGPDAELLVANPVELSGKGRPSVFYDITLALKMLNIGIFSAEVGRYQIGDREWEIYRVLLDEGNGSGPSRNKIVEAVWKMLMGWE
ncbi:hypothetical protein RDI58_021695 [Solanum bulbocastanum]|uniref:ACT domain-containing protein ACR n=1 Tax=Solanum bulbocastanum TaxID=147425 RepID=A0AAN8T983_SOLBU